MTEDKQLGQDTGHDVGKDIPPWLQPVPDEGNIDTAKSSNTVVYVSAGIAIVVLSLFSALIYNSYTDPPALDPIYVAAPEGETKHLPEDEGGLLVANRGLGVHEKRDGTQPAATVKLGEYAETPIPNIPDNAETSKPVANAPDAAAAKKAPNKDPIGDVISATLDTPVVREKSKPSVERKTRTPAAAAKPTPSPSTVAAAPAPASSYRIQLGAYGSKQAAERAWRVVRGKFRTQFVDKSAEYEAVRSGDRTLFRLRVGPFEDRASADQNCLALRTNEQSCIVVNP